MKIIHIVNQGPAQSVMNVIDAQSKDHDVEIINLESGEQDYDALVDKIITCDKLVSWSNVYEDNKR